MQTGLSPMWLFVAVLMALVIVDIVRNDVKVAPRWAWIGATVLLFPIGPILYLLWGRASRRTQGNLSAGA
ncbi:PLD nuclease N-terminal domain-containing protein [Demequina capsici]|uniref:PLD nuclease N-terminal domain-containing protein n=1 Tax=Demequina capsici TaxID=3075620 RepID=A0AA96FCH1_9MICO|nr:PLD nuclease N-terminal domain-containing protein [Demequina sp. PMTSA13]WNM27202.1 PLD nuclease N-terminal domain-containing protein [Demequina sp. PMTSA13]